MIPVIVLTINCLLHIPNVKRTFVLSTVMSRDSFHYEFLEQKSRFYPNLGYETYVMMGNLNYSKELPKIFELSDKIFNQTDILYDVKSWLKPFQNFVRTFYDKDVRTTELTDSEWRFYLSQFLFSSDGGQYNFNFKFEKKLECGQPASNVKVSIDVNGMRCIKYCITFFFFKISTIDFKFKPFCERDEYMPAKYRIDKIIDDAHLESGEGYSSLWSQIFYYWIPNSVNLFA
jgi:Niemann-Pick C1 protein